MSRWCLLLTLAVLLAGCGLPRDPEGTLDRVQGGVLRAGVTAHEPWDRIETDLVERFAQELGARVEWVDGAESELMEALHLRELDLVVGGLTADTPFQDQAAVTRPYVITSTVIGVPAGESLPPDLAGVEVLVEPGTDAAGLLRRRDAVPVPVSDLAAIDGYAAVEDYLLDDLALTDSGVTLAEARHVMAVQMGENGWQVRLERFLFANQPLVAELLEQEGRP